MHAAQLTFDDLNVGDKVTVAHAVTGEKIQEFADLSGDHSPIHVDRSAAKAAGFDGRVAHGALLVAWASQIVGMRLPGRNAVLVEINIKFRAPVLEGDEITLEAEITDLSQATQLMELSLFAFKGGRKAASGKLGVLVR